MLKRLKNWWSKKNKKERKTFVLRTIIAIFIAIALMSLGSAIQFSIKGFNLKNLVLVGTGIIIGWFLKKYFSDDDENTTK